MGSTGSWQGQNVISIHSSKGKPFVVKKANTIPEKEHRKKQQKENEFHRIKTNRVVKKAFLDSMQQKRNAVYKD